jgi:hypothetical protein
MWSVENLFSWVVWNGRWKNSVEHIWINIWRFLDLNKSRYGGEWFEDAKHDLIYSSPTPLPQKAYATNTKVRMFVQ